MIAVTLLQHGADTTIKNSNGKKMTGSLLCVLHDRDHDSGGNEDVAKKI